MELSSVQSFVHTLKKIDHSPSYITKEEGRFYRVESKDKKNLNTAGIAAVAKDAFETLKKTKTSYSAKAKLYEEFSQSIQDCINRIYKHKNFWHKIAWWLGCASSGEKELWNVRKESENLGESLREQDSYMKERIKLFKTTYENRLNDDPKDQLKLLYMGLFDSSPFKFDHLDGISPIYASLWLLNHLEEYRKERGSQSPHAPLIDSVIQEFHVHNDLLLATQVIKSNSVFEWLSVDKSGWTVQETLGQILALQKPGEEVAIAGGYTRSKTEKIGHSFQYIVSLEEEANYSFKIVNTGEGIEYSSPVKDDLSSLWHAVWGRSDLNRKHLKDDVWTGIPKEAFTEEFVQILMKRRTNDIPSCMDDIKQEIEAYLSRFPTVRKGKRREHKAQKKGSCTVKSLASWLHERFGEPLWRDFKVFYTKRELQKIDRLAHQIPDTETRAMFKREGQRILDKRERKKHFFLNATDASVKTKSVFSHLGNWWNSSPQPMNLPH